MKIGLLVKLSLSFLVVVAIIGAAATWMGINLIADGVVKQAQNKVKSDLNAAQEIYLENLSVVGNIVRLTAGRYYIIDALVGKNLPGLQDELNKVEARESLDILGLTDPAGRVIVRALNPLSTGDRTENELVRWVLDKKKVAASSVVLSRAELLKERETLAEQALIKAIPTPMAKPETIAEETRGMVLMAAAPIFDYRGRLIGVLYGGRLLNKNYQLVDKIKDVIFKNETYKGKDIGTATIFLGDVRVSTNVKQQNGERAIGTRVSAKVFDKVLTKGEPYIDRAFVVNSWYITAYEPIRNLTGKIVGILYVGILEKKFSDMKRNAIENFLTIVLIGMAIAIVISHLLARSILRPVNEVVYASRQIGRGNLDYRTKIRANDEVGELGASFNRMAQALKERDEQLKEVTRQQLARSERLATLGQLAAGVAHEINNPLAGILTYVRLIKKKIEGKEGAGDFTRYLNLMERETGRCGTIVKNLLDFSRQSEPNLKPVDVNSIINESLTLLDHKLRLSSIEVIKQLGTIPFVTADFAQIQQTFMNIILNAAEAMEAGGKLTIATRVTERDRRVEIEFNDTGAGIPSEKLAKIFDPFFTTKPKGTGLGLSVVFGIIDRHHGEIDVRSEPGKGTTVFIRLPTSG